MIVLDEQLHGVGLEHAIAAWYRGRVCFTSPSEQAREISPLLRQLFRLAVFRTRIGWMGKVIRVGAGHITYYQTNDARTHIVTEPGTPGRSE